MSSGPISSRNVDSSRKYETSFGSRAATSITIAFFVFFHIFHEIHVFLQSSLLERPSTKPYSWTKCFCLFSHTLIVSFLSTIFATCFAMFLLSDSASKPTARAEGVSFRLVLQNLFFDTVRP